VGPTEYSRLNKTKLGEWLSQIRGSRPIAVVMGGSVNGLSFVRSLGRRGVPTLLLDTDPLIGMYTRFGRSYLLPNPEKKPSEWLDLLEYVADLTDEPRVIFMTSDLHALFVSQHSAWISKHFKFIAPTASATGKIVNKREQYTIAQNAGIPIPETHFPESEAEIRSIAEQISYPCIMKSYQAHAGREKISKKVLLADSSDELVSNFLEYALDDVPFMVQEIIPGPDSNLYGYLALWSEDSKELAYVTKRKLRQSPPHYGDGSLQITTVADEVRDLSVKLLKEFDYCGYAGVEFKLDDRDKSFKLMEINPRTVSGNQIAISAGVDFPWIGYNYLLGKQIDPASIRFTPDVRYVNEEWDFKAFLTLRKSGELSYRAWRKSIKGARARSIWASDDPGPMFTVLWRMFRAALRKITGR